MIEEVVYSPDGHNVIETELKRSKGGIQVRVKIAQEIEEFFEKWGGGYCDGVRDHGRGWTSLNKDTPFQVWAFKGITTVDGDNLGGSSSYSLASVGSPFIIQQPTPNGTPHIVTNLSFLRLVGASKGDGVTFVSDSIMSRTEMSNLADRIKRSSGMFYEEYIKPVHLKISVHVRPIA